MSLSIYSDNFDELTAFKAKLRAPLTRALEIYAGDQLEGIARILGVKREKIIETLVNMTEVPL